MLEININKAVKNYGFKNVLDEFNLDIYENEKVALIGSNGSGKTTLLKIISGEENLNSGTISIRKGSRISFLKQIPPKEYDNYTVKEILEKDMNELLKIEEQLKAIENKKLNTDKLIKKYCKLMDKYEYLGGYEINAKINKICDNFKITHLLSKKFNLLSGGEKTIVNLAALMVKDPTILLLDEPTNHLDIDSLEFLEEYLKNYKGTIIISSHDRYFLDKISTKTVLIERGKSEIFNGNYSYYIKENERRILKEFDDYKNQQKQIEAMKKKIKQLQEFGKLAFPSGEGFFKRANSIQKRLDKIDVLNKPEEKKDLPLDFSFDKRSGKDVLKVKDLTINLDNKEILKNINFKINYQDKICLMGKNGSGKSTLIKAIMGNIKYDGSIILGSNIHIGYIPQEIKFENDNLTILEEAKKHFNGTETLLRSSLAKFLFYESDVFKRVGSLSGGEKVRLKLFELIQKNANFLILDEPTNHIDIDTKEMLEDALKSYSGTFLIVSHDRYFINKLAKKILYIENKEIKEYLGNYDDYKERKENENR